MKQSYNSILLMVLLVFIFAGCSSTKNATPAATAPTETPKPEDPIADKVKSSIAMEGLFTVYQDTTSGSTQMIINYDQIGKEFIYWGHTVDGVVQAGHFRGAYRDNKVFSIQRYYDRIEFVVENTSYHFDEDNALSKAAEANISRAVLVSEKIVAEDKETGRILINADPVFLTESFHQVKPSPIPGLPPGRMFTLGNLSRDKNKFVDIRSYPENTEVIVEYVYENPMPMAGGGPAVTDERSVTIRFQHSFIEMPENDFKPRRDDPRIGYFGQQVNDQTATDPTPYRDVINRWNLVKKDPNAAISEPVEPITWWIENTTPHELRETIAEATLAWNEAFEAAGFRNAIAVKVQPDSADWDAGDIRYNVLRWTSSPMPPFGGYGPSFTNPRTGQIIGADIMLEYVFIRNALNSEKLYSEDMMSTFLNMGVDPKQNHEHTGVFCSAGHFLQFNNMFGFAAVDALDFDEMEKDRLIHDGLYYLIMHELGHTFGLNHNMGAHNLLTPEQLNDRSLTESIGMIGSVMDYPAINVSNDRSRQGQYYTTTAGPYDIWAIEYGYSPSLDDPEAEETRLTTIAERSTDPQLFFGNDADDMRSPGKAIDPRIMIGAMSADPVGYAQDRVKLVRTLQDGLLERYSNENQSYQELHNAFMSSMGQMNQAMTVTSRFIGGVMIDRAFHGQQGATQPFTPVVLADQKRALKSLSDNLFAPDAFKSSHEVYNYLQRQRRGFNFFATSEDPKIHDMALSMHQGVLMHVLHPNVMKRMTDARLYGNEYAVADFMNDLTDAIFRADVRGNVNTFRQNLQVEYVTRLTGFLAAERNPYDYIARSASLQNLERIKSMMANRPRGNAETRAHTRHISLLIEKALEN